MNISYTLIVYATILCLSSFVALARSWLKAAGLRHRYVLLFQVVSSIVAGFIVAAMYGISEQPYYTVIKEVVDHSLESLGLTYLLYHILIRSTPIERLLFPSAHILSKSEDSLALQISLFSQYTIDQIVDNKSGMTVRVLFDPVELGSSMPPVIPNHDQ